MPPEFLGGRDNSWGRFLAATGDGPDDPSKAIIIDEWLVGEDEDAYIAIMNQVSTASISAIGQLDDALTALAVSHLNPQARRRLIKFYAIFKISETQRFREFRGFPE